MCASDVFVAFRQTVITSDLDAAAPGIQTTVQLRTSLAPGEIVTLEVVASDGSVQSTLQQPVDADGDVAFASVEVPAPRVVLRATGRGTCGEGRDEIAVDVLAGADCALGLSPVPEVNPHFAPLDVLGTHTDPDSLTPGYQTTVQIATRPGWTAEIFELTDRERSLGVLSAGSSGVATLPVTVLDGRVGFRAICRGEAGERATPMTTLVVDTTPPACGLRVPAPGTTITAALDANHDLSDGVQLALTARAEGDDVAGEPVVVDIRDPGGLAVAAAAGPTDATGQATGTTTLMPATTPAQFYLALTMQDHAGNQCLATATYDVVYEPALALGFAAPAADGVIGRGDGEVIGDAITLALCGTTTQRAASIEVAIDGGEPAPATVTDTTWCRTVTLDEAPAHTVVAAATANGQAAMATLVVRVDLTPPAPVTDLAAVAIDRQRLRLTWTAPADGSQPVARYVIKSSPTPLSDATFDSAGTVIAGVAPAAPGTVQTLDVAPARVGVAQAFAIAALDDADNRAVVALAGPVTPAFSQTGAILPINAGQGALGLGAALAHGRFNDDDFDDLAVAAPTQSFGGQVAVGAVYVYFGGPSGIAATPELAITSAETGARLGTGLTAVRWSSATRDDLVIGAPGADGGAGRIYVFRAGLAGGTRAATSAEQQISVAATPGWFAAGGLGSVLAGADVDGDGTADLVAAVPRGGGTGGAVILYGDTVTGDVALSDVDAAAANGAIVDWFADPGGAPGRQLGFYLAAVGPTGGALDAGDDLVLAYADDYAATTDSLYLLRGDGARPASAGVTARPFAPGRDVRLDFATTSKVTEWASQITSIDDQDGDGARDLVIGAYRAQNGRGQVAIISGSVVGTAGVARTSDLGVTLTTINPGTGVIRFGAAIAAHDGAARADIDGDGREDLLIAGLDGGGTPTTGRAFVWFGGAIPSGTTTTASAQAQIVAPSTLKFQRQSPQGFGGQARWIGDINHDGLDDVCWASPFDNSGDGSFEVLWDTP